MANHGYVKTRKKITIEGMNEIFEDLSKRLLNDNLVVDYVKSGKENPSAWGEHAWLLTYNSTVDGYEYGRRVCWLNTSRSFEIRHGGGSFEWWIDNLITNEVALKFNGTISDDGDDTKLQGEAEKYDNLEEYLVRGMFDPPNPETPEKVRRYLEQDLELFPPEFREQTLVRYDFRNLAQVIQQS